MSALERLADGLCPISYHEHLGAPTEPGDWSWATLTGGSTSCQLCGGVQWSYDPRLDVITGVYRYRRDPGDGTAWGYVEVFGAAAKRIGDEALEGVIRDLGWTSGVVPYPFT